MLMVLMVLMVLVLGGGGGEWWGEASPCHGRVRWDSEVGTRQRSLPKPPTPPPPVAGDSGTTARWLYVFIVFYSIVNGR